MPSDYSSLFGSSSSRSFQDTSPSRYSSSRSSRRYDTDSLSSFSRRSSTSPSPTRRRSRSPPRSSSSRYDRSDDYSSSRRSNYDDFSSSRYARDTGRRRSSSRPDDFDFESLHISSHSRERSPRRETTRRASRVDDLNFANLRISDSDRWYRDRNDTGSGLRSSNHERSHAPSRINRLREESRYDDLSSSRASRSRSYRDSTSAASGYGEFSRDFQRRGAVSSSEFGRESDAYDRYSSRRRRRSRSPSPEFDYSNLLD